MIYREFAKTNFKVSVVGMGTYYDASWIALAMLLKIKRKKKSKIQALRAGLDNGINFIDSAEIYQSEDLVKEAILGRKRDELFIATKVWSNHLRYDEVEKSCKRSLSKLGTSYVDLYQIHFPNSKVPMKETMRAMEALVDRGLVRNIGISNFSYFEMLEAESALEKYELASTQMHYNIKHRDVEKEILPHCDKEKIAMIPYYPLAHGALARGASFKENVTPGQAALAWLIARSKMNFPIPRASRADHVREDAAAGDIVLTEEEMIKLDGI